MPNIIAISLASYLIGSVPFGYVLVRLFRGADIRQSGSGNIGATNVARTSPGLGIATLILDALKGFAAVYLASRGEIIGSLGWNMNALSAQECSPMSWDLYTRCVLAALFAILGHMFPLWLKFRGGKGVATGLGSFILLAPRAVIVMAGVFLLVAAIFRYVSLASIVAVALFPLLAWLLHDYHEMPIVLAIMAISSILIVAKHHENIRRLLAGTENRLGTKRA